MTRQEPNLPARTFIAAIIGSVVGIAISTLWLTPKHTPEELRIAEVNLRAKMDKEDTAADLSALKGRCDDGQLKATPTGRIGECKAGRWTTPGAPELNKQLELQAMAEQPFTPTKP